MVDGLRAAHVAPPFPSTDVLLEGQKGKLDFCPLVC
jgi:hypothetical protein